MKNKFWDAKEIKIDTENLTPIEIAAIKYNLDLFYTLTFGKKSKLKVEVSNLMRK